MKLLKFIFIINFFQLSCLLCCGQNVRYLGIEDGLSNNTVTAIYKDNNGLMWFGTGDGLNEYDGYSFKKFKNKYRDSTTLPNDNVICIFADINGNICVGTQNGLGILNSKNLQFSQVHFTNVSGHRQSIAGPVTAICRGDKNRLLIATRRSGLLQMTGNQDAQSIPLINNGNVVKKYSATAVLVGNNSGTWVSVDNYGLCKLNEAQKRLEVIEPMLRNCSSIVANSSGNLFLGTEHGLFFYNIQTKYLSKIELNGFSDVKINGLLIDKEQVMFIATDGEGVVKVNNINGVIKIANHLMADTLKSNSVYTVFEDELSRKWIGTLRGGIDIIDSKINQFKTIRHSALTTNSLVSDFTFSFCEDKNGNIWIGTDGGGLSIWNRRTNQYENHIFGVPQGGNFNANYITSIVQDKQKNMWLSTFGPGVQRYDFKTHSFQNIAFVDRGYPNPVWKLCVDKRGTVWAPCYTEDFKHSLYYFDPSQNRFVPTKFYFDTGAIEIIDDGQNGLWIGTFNGLVHVDKDRGVLKKIDLNCAVRSIHLAASGVLWIGTYGRGIFSYQPANDKIVNYTEQNGLCNDKVLNIEEDTQGNIWMSTNFGMSMFNPRTKGFTNFYTADGLQSNQFYFNASTRLASGELIFGGIKGFNIFDPQKIHQYHDFPPLIITGIRVANTAIDATSKYVVGNHTVYNIDHIELPYNKAFISLDFAALEYSMPEKTEYAYMLSGKDKSWINLYNQRNLNFSQLDPGTYVLKIKCTNSYGIWETSTRDIKITVIPPWYRTWWAYVLYAIILASILAAYMIYNQNKTRLEYEVKLIKEVNEKKLAFFTNISHELRTPLTLILNPIKELLHSDGKNLDLIDLSTVYRNSRRLLSLVNQLLLFKSSESEILGLNPGWFNIAEACHEVFLCFNNQVKNKKITYKFCSNDVNTTLYADREKIDIVLFNLLSNAIKYTPENGKVVLTINDLEESVEIQIEDNGKGIPTDTGDKIFEKFYRINQTGRAESGFGIGLYLASKYVEIHGGRLSYTSEPGKNTVFKLVLPKPNNKSIADIAPADNLAKHSNYIVDELIGEAEPIVGQDRYELNELEDSDIIQSKQTILLIDDDPEFRTYLKKILHKNYIVLEAENTKQGFDLLVGNDPDIIVCDVLLKGASGVEFCSKIKESNSFSHIPVILLTGSSSPEIKLKGIECGADDYITKPFENDLLIARIKSTLKGRRLLKKFFLNEITLKQNQFKIPAEYSDFINKCIQIVEGHLEDEEFSTKQFTIEIGMSRSKLFRHIKSVSGLSIVEFIRYIRLRKAASLMMETDMQIKEIAYKVGFSDQKYFREQFNKLFQINPSEFINKYKNSMMEDKLNPMLRFSKKTGNF